MGELRAAARDQLTPDDPYLIGEYALIRELLAECVHELSPEARRRILRRRRSDFDGVQNMGLVIDDERTLAWATGFWGRVHGEALEYARSWLAGEHAEQLRWSLPAADLARR